MIFDQSKTVQFEFINLLHIPSYVQCVLVVMINSSLFSFLQYSYVLKLCYFSFQFHFLRYTKLLPIAWLYLPQSYIELTCHWFCKQFSSMCYVSGNFVFSLAMLLLLLGTNFLCIKLQEATLIYLFLFVEKNLAMYS